MIEFTPKQQTLIDAIKKRQHQYYLFGGGVGSAKTYLGAFLMLNYARLYPKSQIGVFRKNQPALKKTTYRTFQMVAEVLQLKEGTHYKNHKKDSYWEFNNGSLIFFQDLDDRIDSDFNRCKGLELSCAFVDEANEVIEDAFNILRTRIGRRNEHGGHAFILMTCNPAQNFYDPWREDTLEPPFYFLQALATDNPYLDPGYIEQLQALPEAWRQRYLFGNWDFADEDNTLFKMKYLEKALVSTPKLTGHRRVGADIAREGSDKTIFSLIDGVNGQDTIIDVFEPDISKDSTEPILVLVADALEDYCNKHSCSVNDAQIDTVGLGAGVWDTLRARGYAPRSFKSGFQADDPDRYDSMRSEAYYSFAQAIENGEVKFWNGMKRWKNLRQDLVAHSLDISDKIIKVESKKMVKKRIGRSPDDSDTVVIAWYRSKKKGVYVPKRPRLPMMRF